MQLPGVFFSHPAQIVWYSLCASGKGSQPWRGAGRVGPGQVNGGEAGDYLALNAFLHIRNIIATTSIFFHLFKHFCLPIRPSDSICQCRPDRVGGWKSGIGGWGELGQQTKTSFGSRCSRDAQWCMRSKELFVCKVVCVCVCVCARACVRARMCVGVWAHVSGTCAKGSRP